MTAKDFSFIAAVIAQLPRENAIRQTAAQAFADDLRIVNPRFNERIFMDACNVPQLVIPARRIRSGDFIVGYGEVATFFTAEYSDGEERISFYFTGEDGKADSSYSLECLPSDPLRIEREYTD